MTGRKLLDRTLMNDLDEVTARPKPISDEFVEETHEVGLSIDPEEMGEWALRSAAQEDVTQSGRLHEPLSINGESPSDETLSGPNFNSIDGVWGQSVDAAMQAGGVDETRYPSHISDVESEHDADDEEEDEDNHHSTIDFHSNRMREASLLDAPSEDGSDDTISPELREENESGERRPDEDDDDDEWSSAKKAKSGDHDEDDENDEDDGDDDGDDDEGEAVDEAEIEDADVDDSSESSDDDDEDEDDDDEDEDDDDEDDDDDEAEDEASDDDDDDEVDEIAAAGVVAELIETGRDSDDSEPATASRARPGAKSGGRKPAKKAPASKAADNAVKAGKGGGKKKAAKQPAKAAKAPRTPTAAKKKAAPAAKAGKKAAKAAKGGKAAKQPAKAAKATNAKAAAPKKAAKKKAAKAGKRGR